MSTATLMMTAADRLMPMPSADDDIGLPGWLYRSEAFAEDLLPAEAEAPARRRLVSQTALLYPATLVLAVLATVPAAFALG